jgi:hypothetical protein
MHAWRALWECHCQLRLPIQLKAEFARLKMSPTLGAELLGRVRRIANAGAAKVASQTGVEPCDAGLAVRAVQPRTFPSEMHRRPRDANLLGHTMASQVQDETISSDAHLRDTWPLQGGADRDPVITNEALASQEAYVEAIVRHLLNGQSFHPIVARHQSNVPPGKL